MNVSKKGARKYVPMTPAKFGRACLQQFNNVKVNSKWAMGFSELLINMREWSSNRCGLTWKLKATGFGRMYFKLLASTKKSMNSVGGMLPTVIASDGARGGQIVLGKSKTKQSGERYSSTLVELARSGLLPTPTTGSNRNSRNAVQRKGEAHQNHGVALGLAQVLEISSGVLPKEFDSWNQVPAFYNRMLPTPTAREHIGGRLPETLKLKGRTPSNSLGDTINSITGVSSKLNPMFIAEMMGFPAQWTLKPFLRVV